MLIIKYNIGLRTILQHGISELIFYGDLVYEFKRIAGKPNFTIQKLHNGGSGLRLNGGFDVKL